MLKPEVIDTVGAFRALESEWDELLAQSAENNVFLSFAWTRCWWEAFGKEKQLHILVLRGCDGSIQAIAPLMQATIKVSGLPAKSLSLIYNDNASHAGFIIRAGVIDQCLEVFAGYFAANGARWQLIELPNLVVGTPVHASLLAVLRKNKALFAIKRGLVSPFLNLTPIKDWRAYLSSRTKKFRYHIKCWMARGDSEGWVFEDVRDTRDRPAAMEEMCAVSAKSWKGRCNRDIGASNRNKRFIDLLLRASSEKGWLRLWMCRINGIPAAYDLQIEYNKTVFALRSDFDEEFKTYVPGSILQARLLRSYIEQGSAEYDFCGDNDAYKHRWVDQFRAHDHVIIYAATFYGLLLFVLDYVIVYRCREFLRRSAALRKIKRMMAGEKI